MIVTAWNNGTHSASGAGYGFKVTLADRAALFSPGWDDVLVLLPDGTSAKVNVNKPSFWNDTCRELVSKDIGLWLLSTGLAPWPRGKPPKFEMSHSSEREFVVTQPDL